MKLVKSCELLARAMSFWIEIPVDFSQDPKELCELRTNANSLQLATHSFLSHSSQLIARSSQLFLIFAG